MRPERVQSKVECIDAWKDLSIRLENTYGGYNENNILIN